MDVRTLTAQVLAQYEKRRAGQVSAYKVANELSLIRHMLRLAKRWGYVATAPEITLPKKPEGRRRYLAEDELGRLLAACRASRNPHLVAIVTLAVHTGMRKGELLGLEWERIDLSSARITLYEERHAPRGADEPSRLRRAGRAGADGRGADGPPLPAAPRGRLGSDPPRVRIGRGEGEAPRLPVPRSAPHGASHMVMRGASLKDVQEVLGHKDFKVTLRYAHLSPAHLRGAVERLEGLTHAPAAAPAVQNAAPAAQADSVAAGT